MWAYHASKDNNVYEVVGGPFSVGHDEYLLLPIRDKIQENKYLFPYCSLAIEITHNCCQRWCKAATDNFRPLHDLAFAPCPGPRLKISMCSRGTRRGVMIM